MILLESAGGRRFSRSLSENEATGLKVVTAEMPSETGNSARGLPNVDKRTATTTSLVFRDL